MVVPVVMMTECAIAVESPEVELRQNPMVDPVVLAAVPATDFWFF
jgi:hypothetical protein